MKISIVFILLTLAGSINSVEPKDLSKCDPFEVLEAKLDSPQHVISITLKILENVHIDKLVLTDPDGRVFTVNPERNELNAGMVPTYQFVVETGQNFRIGIFRLLVVGQQINKNVSLSHEVEMDVR